MALLWIDGFEQYGTTLNAAINPTDIIEYKYFGHYDERMDIRVGPGASSGNCISLDNVSSALMTPTLTGCHTLIVGFAFKLRDCDTDMMIVDFRPPDERGDGTSWSALSLRCVSANTANEIQLFKGNSAIDASTGVDLQPDTWYYLEMKAYNHATSGTVSVKLDTSEVLSYTGNTSIASSDYNMYSKVRWSMRKTDILYIDDLYICDTTGSKNNDFLGTCNVLCIRPDGDVVDDWTPSTGTDLYAVIDEAQQSSDYISDDTSGNQATFTMESMTGTPIGLMVNVDCVRSGNLNLHPKIITQNGAAGTITDADRGVTPGTSVPITSSVIMETDTDGNDWTNATVNDVRIGVELE